MSLPIRGQDRLSELHDQINACIDCRREPGYVKPPPLLRGTADAHVMVIGEAPGGTEAAGGGIAFAGQAGRRLDQWLVASGAPPLNPRAATYLTSVVKCAAHRTAFPALQRRCRRWIDAQGRLLNPELVITLGAKAFAELNFTDLNYQTGVCQIFDSSEWVLIPRFGRPHLWLPWPHPSGRNRWMNLPENRERLQQSFEAVQKIVTWEIT